MWVIFVRGGPNCLNFPVDYLIRTMCLLSGVLCNSDNQKVLIVLGNNLKAPKLSNKL